MHNLRFSNEAVSDNATERKWATYEKTDLRGQNLLVESDYYDWRLSAAQVPTMQQFIGFANGQAFKIQAIKRRTG